MRECVQVQDPFTWPVGKILKQEAFVTSLRRSSKARREHDVNNYSEPIMLRNLYRKLACSSHIVIVVLSVYVHNFS